MFLRYLRKYWLEVEINRRHFLFPSNHPRKAYNPKTLNEILDSATKRAGIKKKVSVHTLRHSYATHSLEDGLNLRYIQRIFASFNWSFKGAVEGYQCNYKL